MLLTVEHRTEYRYEPPAQGLALRLRLFPTPTAQLVVRDWQVTVNGTAVKPLLTTGFGEKEALWFERRKGEALTVEARGTVETQDQAGVLGREPRLRPAVYLRETPLTEPDEAVEALAAKAREETEAQGPLALAHALNEAVHATLDYRAGATDATTTAAEAAAIGAGVCQDFAHLFISAARSLNLPARYVVGYLHDDEAPEMASHAWAEAYLDGLGWVGFDPVHEVCPTIAHIRLCTGFDAADAAPIRGTMMAGSEEEMEVTVAVAAAQQQSQRQSQGAGGRSGSN
ncbi:MAG: transglutaminase family protein [Pseudomonadota bacterium]